ncbi:putative glycoside hydrolase family 16 [Phaeomoniella chlamydospora]|uniref:Putative glycoside hydrolase family 16 n=1 Tax=Phaeomoniella chlamydospora TaxID=158046 RepID=A0A0G2GMW9_PHACM|nr:putative glycoside hydrolase family 16 [Phaeomoniella chlamydospora]
MGFGKLFAVLLLLRLSGAQNQATQDVQYCTCGFYDEAVDKVFTESSIVYFNETDGIPTDDFVVEEFEHRYDRGWNTMYREGASVDNVAIVNDTTARNLTSLQLTCNPSTPGHLVVGGSMRTARQDIFFGSFRASMRAPRHWYHGSALSMILDHNQTQRWNVDIMNTDNSSWAWVATLIKGSFADVWLGTNFSTLQNQSIDPWYYVEYRVDWTRDSIAYYIGGELVRNYTHRTNGTLPSTPAPIRFQHWSTGNEYSTQGPPLHDSPANIAWTRLFFNSSTMTKADHKAFNERCSPSNACRMDNIGLRGSTTYTKESLKPWKQKHPKKKIPWIALVIDIAFAALAVILTTKTVWRRLSWKKVRNSLPYAQKSESSTRSSLSDAGSDETTDSSNLSSTDGKKQASFSGTEISNIPSFEAPPVYSGTHTPAPQYRTPAASTRPSRRNSRDDLAIEPIIEGHASSPSGSLYHESRGGRSMPRMTTRYREDYQGATYAANPFVPPPPSELSTPAPEGLPNNPMTPGVSTPSLAAPMHGIPENVPPTSQTVPGGNNVQTKSSAVSEDKVAANVAATPAVAKVAPAKRVDYLAGFIAFSSLMVTLNHFMLTFCAAVIEPSVKPHYESEIWARKTIATYFLDPLWIGPFLMISTHFLVSNYLRTANLGNMAQKIVVRPFRLLTPVATIAFLEYFLMDTGAVNYLEYLPSVTWSPWPFTTIVENPGVYISELIQLAFLIPNAAPNITYNYCTGVLWTIPVQLQGAWQTLIALVMICQIKTPWKRAAFYTFCIVNHWYALSWGSYYYAGIALADLELTYKWTKWLHSHPWVYYPLLNFLIILAFGSFTIDMVTQWTGVNYAQVEYGWHPYADTGKTISQSGASTYPDYFIPRLNALLATVSMQTVVEINPSLQKALSAKFLQKLFPHIFTIYLIHGFIFWSIGSAAMISFFELRLPYWLCVLLTAIVCYGGLFLTLPLLTPPIEAVGKKFTMSLWEHGSEEPIPRKGTTWPFGKELLAREFKPTPVIRREGEQKDRAMEESFQTEMERQKGKTIFKEAEAAMEKTDHQRTTMF